MGLKKLAEKVADYNTRLENGEASKIKPGHVEKVKRKLREKEAELVADLAKTENHERIDRLKRKIAIAREQIGRAEWLLEQLS